MRYSSRFPLSFGQGKAFLALSLMAFLVACSSEIEQALPAASESGGPVTISVRDAYGQQWAEFGVQCPYTSVDDVSEHLGLEPDEAYDLGSYDTQEVVYLKDADGDVDFDVLDRLDVTLCSHRAPEYFGYRGWLPADLPLIFEVNYDGWALTGVGDTTTE